MSGKKLLPNGKRVSNLSKRPSTAKAADQHRRLKKLLGAVYDRFNSAGTNASRHSFVFHMTDWVGDLEALAALYAEPQAYTKAQASDVVAGFLYHALWHVRAAARLLLSFEPEDIFKDIDGDQQLVGSKSGKLKT